MYTAYAIVLLRLVKNTETVYLIYIVGTLVRVTVWLVNSWKLTGWSRSLFRLYFLSDANLLLWLCSAMTYTSLNYKKSKSKLSIIAVCVYPILLFFLSGNFRVMMHYCEWKKWQVCFYKFVRFNAALFYLGYGIYHSIDDNIPNPELDLLFIFTTFGFYA